MSSRTENQLCRDKAGDIIAEITFSGLCIVRIGKPEQPAGGENGKKSRRPSRAQNIEVLLVDTLSEQAMEGCRGHGGGAQYGDHHRHYPCLTYYAEDDLGLHARSDRWNGVLLPSPEGKEVVSIDLRHKRVEIIPPWPYEEEWSKLTWCDDTADHPKDPTEDDRLDWVLKNDQLGLQSLEPEKAVAVVTGLPDPAGKRALPNGEWLSGGVHRNREVRSLRTIRWKIGEEKDPRTLARNLVLRLPCLTAGVTLRISNLIEDEDPYDIVLTPGGDNRLRFSISNLPRSLSEPWDSHLKMLTNLGGGEIVDIVQHDHVVCVTGTSCEIGMYLD